jgi:type III secretion protein C
MRRALILGLLTLVAVASPSAAEPPVPASAGSIAITARDQPIAGFLRDLFAQVGRPVVISPGLTGTVNGRFSAPAAEVFRDISRAFGIVAFYDGAAVYIYPASELTVRSFQTGRAGAARVMRTAAELRLLDAENRLRVASDGTLVATGTPRFADMVAELVRTARAELTGTDALPGGRAGAARGSRPAGRVAQPEALEFRVYYLSYARADDTLVTAGGREVRIPGLASILRGLVVDPRERALLALGSRPDARLVPAARTGLRAQGMGALSPADDWLGLPPAAQPILQDLEATPMAGPDTVRIEANPAINALVIRDTRARLQAYDALIRALDIAPELVEVEATIIDINTTRLRELGVNWRLATGGLNLLLGDGTARDLSLTPDGRLNRRDNALAITPAAPGLSISTVIGSGREFLSRITALEERGAARIVSRPQVMTLSNIEAVFDRTRTFFVRVAGEREVDLFNVTVGTVLRVNPQVIPHEQEVRIQLLVHVEDGQVSRSESVDGIPLVDRAGVSTRAIILDGESLLLGGQTVDSEFDAERKVPLLGDIPVVGNLFKSRRRDRERVERLFLITPRLLAIGAASASAAGAAVQESAP